MTFEVRNGCFGYKKIVPILKKHLVLRREPSGPGGPSAERRRQDTTLLRSMMGMLP